MNHRKQLFMAKRNSLGLVYPQIFICFLLGCTQNGKDDLKAVADIQINCSRPSQVILRLPPKMPIDATKSGHCIYDLSIDANGSVENVTIVSCSENIFEAATLEAAYQSRYPRRYLPNEGNCRAVAYELKDRRYTYQLFDEDGLIIPE